jgi:hypothetical protein
MCFRRKKIHPLQKDIYMKSKQNTIYKSKSSDIIVDLLDLKTIDENNVREISEYSIDKLNFNCINIVYPESIINIDNNSNCTSLISIQRLNATSENRTISINSEISVLNDND